MKKPWIRIIAAAAIVFAGCLFMFRRLQGEPEIFAIVAATILMILGAHAHRGIRTFLALHARGLFWAGVTILLATPIVLFSSAYIIGIDLNGPSGSIASTMFLGTAMIGVFLISVPRSFRDAARLERSPLPVPISSGSFNGLREAWLALRNAPDNISVLFRLAIPWILALSIVPRLTLGVAAALSGGDFLFFQPPDAQIGKGLRVLGEQMPTLILLALAVPCFAVAWHRFVLKDLRGGATFAWPNRATWPYLWRLTILTMVLATLIRLVLSSAGRDLAGLLGTSNREAVAGVLMLAIVFLFLVGASSYSLMFPAIAVGDERVSNMQASLHAARGIGRWYAVGLPLALLPYLLLKLAISDLLFRVFGAADTLAALVIGWGLQLLFFAAIASGATYLSSAYSQAMRTSQSATDADERALPQQS